MEIYKMICQIWQHPRWLMAVCVELYSFDSKKSKTLQNRPEDPAKSNLNSFLQMRTRSIYVLESIDAQ